MRIVHAPHAYAPAVGGAEGYCRGLSEAIAALGHEVHVVAPNISNAEAFYELGHTAAGPKIETVDGVRIERIPYTNLSYRTAGWLSTRGVSRPTAADRLIERASDRFCSRLRAQIAQIEPDVVLSLPHLFPNVRCLLASPTDTPLIIAPMLHESDPNWPFDEVRAAVSRADAVISLTAHEAERLTSAYGADPDLVAIVPPGVSVRPLSSNPAYPDRPPCVVYAGRQAASKNLDLLLRAMDLVWNRLPDTELVIAGAPGDFDVLGRDSLSTGGPESARNRIVIIDSPSADEMRSILAEARVVVSPSLRESFGMVILEAWETETPVVAIDTPISRSIVSDGKDGILTTPSDSPLAEAIVSLLDDASLATSMGELGRSKVLETYTWQRSAESALTLYGQLI